jgi:hypothetical protein
VGHSGFSFSPFSPFSPFSSNAKRNQIRLDTSTVYSGQGGSSKDRYTTLGPLQSWRVDRPPTARLSVGVSKGFRSMRMTNLKRSALAIAISIVASSPPLAYAQSPICAPPSPSETYLAVCKPGWVVVNNVTRLLSRLSVDHLFKPPPPPFSYSIGDLILPIVGGQLVADDDLRDFVEGLAPIDFTQLDKSTGTLSVNLEPAPRTFGAEFESDDQQSHLSLRLPIHLEGGYWRAPDVLQIAFWKDHRPGFTYAFGDGQLVEGDVACVSLSVENLKIDLEDEDQVGIIVFFGECE